MQQPVYIRKTNPGLISVQSLGKYKDTPAAKFKKEFPLIPKVAKVPVKPVRAVRAIKPAAVEPPPVEVIVPPPPKKIVRQCNFCQVLYYSFHTCQSSN